MQLFYREKGDRSLPTLIILHGLWGASENWLPIANRLSAYYHVMVPDLPNHGASPHIPQHNYTALADCIYQWITSLNLQSPLYFAGHSMGGKILMALLLKYPGITRKALIIDISPKNYTQAPESRLHENLCHYLQATPLHKFQERNTILNNIKAHFPAEELFQLLAKNIRKNKTTGSFEWKINVNTICRNLSCLQDWDIPLSCHPYSGKLLFIKGENSNYIDFKEDTSTIRHFFPEAVFTTIPHASHAIHAEQPELLTDCILKFLQN